LNEHGDGQAESKDDGCHDRNRRQHLFLAVPFSPDFRGCRHYDNKTASAATGGRLRGKKEKWYEFAD
jgi:hypothetical protein